MALRGTGEVLGIKQSGKVTLKIANLTIDTDLVEQTMKDAENIVKSDLQLSSPPHANIRTEFLRLYRDAESYLHVG